ncbi:hypothetical protein Htur_1354 [Haloterrigena turkmenica DSM 5511]|uniref:Uncharacterized protein n=1 Tax=Haloterrigena turkmenica (strain ATCC 51198 / DSM 5511 / JCM 9101 / NCIMB 13204 / VKM B-1734 / 4k) TaxID=543526 RepID=D2RPY3_HALTV|nr:hypothetical protein Htur_1354 [Haloterrigena turkmenica DSM 5511]
MSGFLVQIFARAVSRRLIREEKVGLEITKLETLLTLADRMDLPAEVVDPLEQTKAEAENGLESVRTLTA